MLQCKTPLASLTLSLFGVTRQVCCTNKRETPTCDSAGLAKGALHCNMLHCQELGKD
jgi:hypothetical protein